jgi:hypothetical protein
LLIVATSQVDHRYPMWVGHSGGDQLNMMAKVELKLPSQIHACGFTQPKCIFTSRFNSLDIFDIFDSWLASWLCQLPYFAPWVCQVCLPSQVPRWENHGHGNPMCRECMEHLLPKRLLQMVLMTKIKGFPLTTMPVGPSMFPHVGSSQIICTASAAPWIFGSTQNPWGTVIWQRLQFQALG